MTYVQRVMRGLEEKYAYEPEFLQAAHNVLETLQPLLDSDRKYEKNKILERIVEPERTNFFQGAVG